MKATIIQTHLYWEDRKKNLAHFAALLDTLKDQTDLIVLPEMFTTGFTMSPEKNAEPFKGEALHWLKQKAQEKNAVITGSMAVEEDGRYYNRLFWVQPNGAVDIYNKRHLFRLAKEDQHYEAGDKKIIMPLKGWNVCPLVCYDLRFPVWSRNRFSRQKAVGSGQEAAMKQSTARFIEGDSYEAEHSSLHENDEAEHSSLHENNKAEHSSVHYSGQWDYDVLIYVANWPEVRSYPWKQLLIARAIENQCYVIGVNRIGKDGNDFAHSGDSVVINPRGEIMSKTQPNEESVETVMLDRHYLDEFRKIFPVGLDADDFELK